MKRILVSVTNDLVTDQRVHKVCTSLHKEGYNITLIGRLLDNRNPLNRKYKTKRMHLFFREGFLFYAEYNIRLFFILFFSKKDILIANDLDTLLPNFLVSEIFKKKLVYDSHELFTEVPELISRPRVQKVWIEIEKLILPKLFNCITVCNSIAEYYHKKYNLTFHIIKNVPANITPKSIDLNFNRKNKKIILYQGSLNKGRGIELMIDTMSYLENFIFVIIGSGDIEKKLKRHTIQNNISDKIVFLGRVEPEKLKSITIHADLGISFEEDLGLNYHYALPNKIFDYIYAKVPSLVSNLPEMKNLVVTNHFGDVIKVRDPKKIAEQINNAFEDSLTYNFWKKNLNKPNEFIWEHEEHKLKSIFKELR